MPEHDSEHHEARSTLRRAGRNFVKLLSGRGVAALLELGTVVILARVLAPGLFGSIVLMQTYVLVFNGLFNFKLYEVLVRFGVPLLEEGRKRKFRHLLQLTLFVDLASCAVAAVIAVLATLLMARLFGWETDIIPDAMLYSSVLLTYGYGSAKGLLRIFDRYDLLALQLGVGPVLRLAGVGLVTLTGPGLAAYVVALVVATAIGNLFLIGAGIAEFRRRIGPIGLPRARLGRLQQQFPGLRKFMIVLYWQGNVDLLPRHMSTLFAGALLGPAAAGMLRLSREATKILAKPGALLMQVLFPDLVRMWLRGGSAFRRVLVHALGIAAVFGLVFVIASALGGRAALEAALGTEYAVAAPLMTLLLLAATLELMAGVLRGAGYAIGCSGEILRLHIISSLVYLVLFAGLTASIGLIGAGIAATFAALIPLIGIGRLVRRHIAGGSATAERPHPAAGHDRPPPASVD